MADLETPYASNSRHLTIPFHRDQRILRFADLRKGPADHAPACRGKAPGKPWDPAVPVSERSRLHLGRGVVPLAHIPTRRAQGRPHWPEAEPLREWRVPEGVRERALRLIGGRARPTGTSLTSHAVDSSPVWFSFSTKTAFARRVITLPQRWTHSTSDARTGAVSPFRVPGDSVRLAYEERGREVACAGAEIRVGRGPHIASFCLADDRVATLVPRGGIEPPTLGFSGAIPRRPRPQLRMVFPSTKPRG